MSDILDALLLADEAQRRATTPGHSAWVEANAGTGKTKVLTDRVTRLLLVGVRPARILCLTFTKAAAAEMRNRLAGQLEYSTTLFDATTMQRLLGHYEAVLARAVADPDLPISALAGPTEAERHQILEEWNDTRIEFGPGRCIHPWVEEQVEAMEEGPLVA